MAQNQTIIDAAKEFSTAFSKLGNDSLPKECSLALNQHYEEFMNRLSNNMEIKKETQQLIKQINLTHNVQLDVQVSMSNGSVIAGIIGNENFSFDVWGPTVVEVFKMNSLDADEEIIVVDNVRERLLDLYEFETFEQLLKDGTTVFKLKEKTKK